MEIIKKLFAAARPPNEIRQVHIEADPAVVARIAENVAAAKARLGERWLLHPSHSVQRKP